MSDEITMLDRPTSTTDNGCPTASRGGFLKNAAAGGAAIIGGGALLGAFAQAAAADPGDGIYDKNVLNYALTLEYLEAEFYTQALGGPGTTGVPGSSGLFSADDLKHGVLAGEGKDNKHDAYTLLTAIRDHEVAHVDFLRTALGAGAVGPC